MLDLLRFLRSDLCALNIRHSRVSIFPVHWKATEKLPTPRIKWSSERKKEVKMGSFLSLPSEFISKTFHSPEYLLTCFHSIQGSHVTFTSFHSENFLKITNRCSGIANSYGIKTNKCWFQLCCVCSLNTITFCTETDSQKCS